MADSSRSAFPIFGGRGGIVIWAAALAIGASALVTADAATAPATQPAPRTASQKKLDDIDRVMEFFRLTQPDVYEQAKSLRETDPLIFEKLITGTIPTVNHFESIRKKSQELFDLSMKDLQLNYQSMRIAYTLKRPNLSDADRKQFTDQMQSTVTEEFSVQQRIRQLEIEELQKKVKDLGDQVHDRETEKNTIISKRIDDLERAPSWIGE